MAAVTASLVLAPLGHQLLAKPTAALHGAPLVLGRLLVDTRSVVRLAPVLGVDGASAVLLLNVPGARCLPVPNEQDPFDVRLAAR